MKFGRVVFDFHRTISEKVESITPALRKFDEFIRSVDFEALTENMDIALESFEKGVSEYKKLIVKLGYPPDENLPAILTMDIYNDYLEHGEDYIREKIDGYMISHYDDNEISNILFRWEENELLKPRLPILRDGIKCHKQQMYTASIPTILPQLEGTVASGFNHLGYMKQHQLKKYLEEALIRDEKDLSFDDALHNYYTTIILKSFGHNQHIEVQPSRHAILHGGDYNYATKTNSIKIILMMDYMAEVMEKIYQEKTRKVSAKDEE